MDIVGIPFAVHTDSMPLQTRRRQRLRHYDYSTPGGYFVTMCTAGRCKVLEKLEPILLEELRDLSRRFPGVTIDFHVVMADHMHVVFVLPGGTSLVAIVQTFKSRTTLKSRSADFTARRLWQRGYYEHVIRNERELRRIREYIVNNPLAEKLEFLEDQNLVNTNASPRGRTGRASLT